MDAIAADTAPDAAKSGTFKLGGAISVHRSRARRHATDRFWGSRGELLREIGPTHFDRHGAAQSSTARAA